MVEGPDIQPGLGCMAGEAFPRESQGDVVNLLRRFEILLMARQAVRRKWAEASSQVVGVAGLTAELKMGAVERETRRLVNPYARNVFE